MVSCSLDILFEDECAGIHGSHHHVSFAIGRNKAMRLLCDSCSLPGLLRFGVSASIPDARSMRFLIHSFLNSQQAASASFLLGGVVLTCMLTSMFMLRCVHMHMYGCSYGAIQNRRRAREPELPHSCYKRCVTGRRLSLQTLRLFFTGTTVLIVIFQPCDKPRQIVFDKPRISRVCNGRLSALALRHGGSTHGHMAQYIYAHVLAFVL